MNKLLLSNEAISIAVRDFFKIYHILGVKLVLTNIILSDTRSGNILSFLLPLFQEGQLSVTGESMCTKYWLTA